MNEELRRLLAGYLDGELSADERVRFEAELARNPELKAELDEHAKVKEVTEMVHYADLPEEVWETYWQSLYRKLERGLGWIFLSIGFIVLAGFGLVRVFEGFFFNPDVSVWLKLGLGAGGAGMLILLVSFIRERLFAYRRERYREVTR